jgi:DNA repair exonuclease SbcCD ATPase subunit
MRLISYEAHNVKRVKDIEFDMEGHHLFLVGGKNGQGKSSALDALLMALCGRSGMDYPEVQLKDGEEEGWVKVKLSGDDDLQEPEGLTVELFLTRKRDKSVAEKFRILDSSGEEAPEPRALLRRLYDLRAFDPLEFCRKDKKEKREILQRIVGIDPDKGKAELKALYDERTVVNREAAKLVAQAESAVHHKDAPQEEVSTAKLLGELERRQGVNQANKKARQELETRRELVKQNDAEEDRVREQIEQLRKRTADLKANGKLLMDKLSSQEDTVKALKDEDESEIRSQMKDADGLNQKFRDNAKKAELQKQAKAAQRRADDLSEKMKEIEKEQAEAIRKAKFPVEGLSFDTDGVLYNGLPFEQSCKSLQTKVSFAIGMALKPKLKLFVCQDGSDLDEDSISALDECLKENGFQAIVELVTRTKEDEDLCAVVIEDGRVKA